MADDALPILSPLQVDAGAKADAWEAYTSAKNQDELGVRLQGINIPQDAKAQLWEAKKNATPPAQPPSAFTPGDFQTMQGSPIYNPNRLGSQALPYASQGAAVSGALARGQQPDFPQQVQGSAENAAAMAPEIGGFMGMVGGAPGMALGTGMGTIAQARLRGQPASGSDVARNTAISAALGYGTEYGIKGLGKLIPRLAGVPQAVEDAQAKYTSDLADQAEAARQRRIGKDINVQKYKDFQASIPPSPPGEQSLWQDLNKSVQVSPSKIRIRADAPDLSGAVTMPGRGLASEGLRAADLAKMTPIEQTAAIAPKWNAAGRAVDAMADQATKAGKVVNLYKLDEAVDGLEDPNARQSVQKVINRVGKSLGIQDWGNVTPTQALQLRRELQGAGSNGDYVSRAVTNELRAAVPEMKGVDQHYSDLNGAMMSVRDQMKRYSAGKFKYPQMEPTPPTYQKLAKVPTVGPPPDLQGISRDLRNQYLASKGRQAATGVIGGAAAGAGYELYNALRKQ